MLERQLERTEADLRRIARIPPACGSATKRRRNRRALSTARMAIALGRQLVDKVKRSYSQKTFVCAYSALLNGREAMAQIKV